MAEKKGNYVNTQDGYKPQDSIQSTHKMINTSEPGFKGGYQPTSQGESVSKSQKSATPPPGKE